MIQQVKAESKDAGLLESWAIDFEMLELQQRIGQGGL